MPAIKRYKSRRIAKVAQLAHERGETFAILSGRLGLIDENELVPYYDHLLLSAEVDELAVKVGAQLREFGEKELEFYYRPNDAAWDPYIQVIKQATKYTSVKLIMVELSGNH